MLETWTECHYKRWVNLFECCERNPLYLFVISFRFLFYRYSIDYDVTAFVNGETPPFDDVLDDFQNVILANFDVKEENMKVTSRSVGFKLDDIDFDLLPATNLANRDVEGLCFLVEFISKIENTQDSFWLTRNAKNIM